MPPRACTTKAKPAPAAEPTVAVEETVAPPAEPTVADAPSPALAVADGPETVEEFRVRATTTDGESFLVRAGRIYATRADAESAITTDRRRYRWSTAPAEPAYVVEARTVTRSAWA